LTPETYNLYYNELELTSIMIVFGLNYQKVAYAVTGHTSQSDIIIVLNRIFYRLSCMISPR